MSYHQSGEQQPPRPYPYRQGHPQQHPPTQYGYQQQHPHQIPPAQQQQWQHRRFRRQQQHWLQEQGHPQYQQHYHEGQLQQQDWYHQQHQYHQFQHPQQHGPLQYHQPEQRQQYEPHQYPQHHQQQYEQQYQQQGPPRHLQQQGPPRHLQQQGQCQQYQKPRQQQHWRQRRFEKDLRKQPRQDKPGTVTKTDFVKLDAETSKRNRDSKAEGNKIPLKVLKQALGHVISVETVNGYIVKGKLTDIQVINMNCELSQWVDENNEICPVTSTRASKESVKMYDVLFVRGSMVRYWILPDVLINYTTTLITEFIKQRQEIIDQIATQKGKTPGLKRSQQENPLLAPLSPIHIDIVEDENLDASDWFFIGRKDSIEDKQDPKPSPTEGQRSPKPSPSDTAPISTASPHEESQVTQLQPAGSTESDWDPISKDTSQQGREESQVTHSQRPGSSSQVPMKSDLVPPQGPITVRISAPVKKPSYPYYDYHPRVPMKRQSTEAPSHIQTQKSRKSYPAKSKESDWDPISKATSKQGPEESQVTQTQRPGGSSHLPMKAHPTSVPAVRPPPVQGPSYYHYYSHQGSEQIPTITGGQIQHPVRHPTPGQGMPPRTAYTGIHPPYPVLPGPVEGQLLYPPHGQVQHYPQYSPQAQHPPQIQQPYPILPYPAVPVPQFVPGQVLVAPPLQSPPAEGIHQTVLNIRGKDIVATEIGGTTYFDQPPSPQP